MFETLSILPFSFWVVILLIIAGGIFSFGRLNDGTGLPMLAVLGTVTAWYVGDAFYNDYANNHAILFSPEVLSSAWWQVAWFILVFLLATPFLHRKISAAHLTRRSGVLQLFKLGMDQPVIQKQINTLFVGCAGVWLVLLVIAIVKLQDQSVFYIFPFLGYQANPWEHAQIGSGLDCFSIVFEYLQLLSATMFGVVLALAANPRIRACALSLCIVSWPFFIFSRTRNQLLALIIPAILCWVFLRLRSRMWKKIAVLAMFFLVINVWMKFIIANRSHTSITAAFQGGGLNLAEQKKVHNEGLNMYEELCWISTFIENGRYRVNWGERYFAEMVNPVPRGLWKGKPLIGLDYAIARGHHITGPNGTVDTTISTGMIGQGVVNFGRVMGPAAAALLMGLWVVWLARFDLQVTEFGRLPLYALGLILTFNLGRDITLITLYPFIFGALLIWWIDHLRLAPAMTSSKVPELAVAQAVAGQASVHPGTNSSRRLDFAVASRPKFKPRPSAVLTRQK
jgi:hypothetical protein